MKYEINNELFEVIIERKNNKNTYIKVKDDLKIYVTTNYFVSNSKVVKIIDENVISIKKMIDKKRSEVEKSEMFFYLGNNYDIIEVPIIDNVDIDYTNHNIYIKNRRQLDKWLSNEILKVFGDRYNYCFNNFNESVKMPSLKIRNMKTRWGVYNRKSHSVTLNSQLIKYDIDKLDYVIIHELCHIIHFNHSKDFWNLVGKYCKDYKKIRKELKE